MDLWLKLIVMQGGLLAIQTMLYFGVQYFEGPAHDMKRPWDEKIPFLPQAFFIYVLWYPLIAIYPLVLYAFSPEDYGTYILAIMVDICISITIYYVYPTSFERPAPPKERLSGKVMAWMHVANYTGKNCMPSMHCSMCFIIMISAMTCGALPIAVFGAVEVIAVSIVVSTVLTKQHVLIDMITALPLALLCILISEKCVF